MPQGKSYDRRTRSQVRRIRNGKFSNAMKSKLKNKDTDSEIETTDTETTNMKITDIKKEIIKLADKQKVGQMKKLIKDLVELVEKKAEEEDEGDGKTPGDQNEIFLEKIKELETDNSAMKNKLTENKMQIEELLQEHTEQITYHEEKEKDHLIQIKQLERIIEIKEKEDKEKNLEMERSEAKMEKLEQEYGHQKLENKKYKEEQEILKKKVSELNEEYERLKEEIRRYENEITKLQKIYEEQKELFERSQEECIGHKNEIRKQEKTIKTMEEEKEGMKISMEGLQKIIDELNDTLPLNECQENTKIGEADSSFEILDNIKQRPMNKNNYQISYAQEINDNDISDSNNTTPMRRNKENNNKTNKQDSNKNDKNERQNSKGNENILKQNAEKNHDDKDVEKIKTKQKQKDCKTPNKNDAGRKVNETEKNETTRDQNEKEITIDDGTEINKGNAEKIFKILKEIEKKVQTNTEEISKIKGDGNKKKTLEKTTENKGYNGKKKMINLIGDSHMRYMKEKLEKEINTQEWNIEENFKPGYTYENIVKELLPQNVSDEDILVISAGTNDIYKTEWTRIKNCIDLLGEKKCKIILVLIPPQNNYTNENIIKLNTLIKHHTRKYNQITLVNPHKFIQGWHMAVDGIHLGRRGKIYLGKKIAEHINNDQNKTEEINNYENQSSKLEEIQIMRNGKKTQLKKINERYSDRSNMMSNNVNKGKRNVGYGMDIYKGNESYNWTSHNWNNSTNQYKQQTNTSNRKNNSQENTGFVNSISYRDRTFQNLVQKNPTQWPYLPKNQPNHEINMCLKCNQSIKYAIHNDYFTKEATSQQII
ncbi:hypothetical protein M8J77_017463 [Diaphorina citri]|nr:hypothetical protein M8J77_017463 [Diaphorina citri]